MVLVNKKYPHLATQDPLRTSGMHLKLAPDRLVAHILEHGPDGVNASGHLPTMRVAIAHLGATSAELRCKIGRRGNESFDRETLARIAMIDAQRESIEAAYIGILLPAKNKMVA